MTGSGATHNGNPSLHSARHKATPQREGTSEENDRRKQKKKNFYQRRSDIAVSGRRNVDTGLIVWQNSIGRISYDA